MTNAPRLKYLQAYTDRLGRRRHYLRRKGAKAIPLRGEPGTEAFMAAYARALKTVPSPKPQRRNGLSKPAIPTWLRGRKSGVYFIRAAGRIKIGITRDIERRLVDIQIGSPSAIYLVLIVRGGAALERELHTRFRPHRAHGEWFNEAPEIIDYVRAERTKLVQKRLPDPRRVSTLSDNPLIAGAIL